MKVDKIQEAQITKLPERPTLVNRPRCTTFKLEGGCWDCGNETFRYYNAIFGKRYYQCEKFRAINH